jgi:molecular chaperone DnaK (HSP70)
MNMQLGIDIGTHVAQAATLDAEGRPRLVASLPALARQTMHGLVVGAEAARALAGNAETTVSGCTRLMGRAGEIPPALLERLPYPVREVGGEAVCNLAYAEVRASEIYGRMVRELVGMASQRMGQAVDDVMLTVPASAEDRFRIQARAAAEAQGVRVRRLINQPAAALLAAQLPTTAARVAVVNCGGGSTDVSIAERSDAGARILATAGDATLGGDDMAWAVAEELNARFRRRASVDVFAVGQSRAAAVGLRNAAEEALQTLCIAPVTTLVLDHGGGFGRDLVAVVRREDVSRWLAPLMERVGALCERALRSSQLDAPQVDAVLLTGDWAHLPAVQERVARAFERPVARLHSGNAPLLPVYGAALATASGARLAWDVTPFALGINCYYGDVELFSPIIAANTPIPTPPTGGEGAHTEPYQTRFPDQTSVTLDVLQYRGPCIPDPRGAGRVRPKECEVLGSWKFDGLRPKKGRHAKFRVTFAVDGDGILHLYAKETATGHHLEAQVERGIG